MKQMRVALLSCDGARELARALRGILCASPSGEFQLTEAALPDAQQGWRALVESKISGRTPQDLFVICLLGTDVNRVASTLRELRECLRDIPVLLVVEANCPEPLYDVLKLGVADFILSPLRPHEVLPRIQRLLQQSAETDAPVRHLKESLGLRQFVGESEALLREIRQIPNLARCDVSVLIGGETGTGKEMIARAIHHLSSRSEKSFIAVNCGALPDDLVENELFGHQEGAFTGASSSAFGLIHEADGGTIFLDEIDALPLKSQVKLLRFLQEKEYRPLGSNKTCKSDARVLAASNANFEEIVRTGRFRSDLYYRLNVVPMRLPALRDRKEDIPRLARHILAKSALAFKKASQGFSPAAMQKLMFYNWPGNIRELENVIERAVILSGQPVIGSEDIRLPASAQLEDNASFKALKAKAIADFERNYVQELLLDHGGNITQAAKAAKKHRRAFWQLMQKHRLASPGAGADH